MRKITFFSLLIICITMILIAGCTNVTGSTNTTSTPTPQDMTVTVTPTPMLVETSTSGVVTVAPTISTTCGDLISDSGADQAFLNFVNDNYLATRIKGLAYGNCSRIPADQLHQLIITSAIPQTHSLAQARVYLISATTYCQNPDSAAQNNTETDLEKFEKGMNEYQNLVYSCQNQIRANASSVVGGETLAMNNIVGPQTFSGKGNSAKKFSVAEGEYKFSTTYAGDGNFIVHISNTYGKTELFNKTGPYSGSTIVNLTTGEYYMNIEASAPYLIKMTHS